MILVASEEEIFLDPTNSSQQHSTQLSQILSQSSSKLPLALPDHSQSSYSSSSSSSPSSSQLFHNQSPLRPAGLVETLKRATFKSAQFLWRSLYHVKTWMTLTLRDYLSGLFTHLHLSNPDSDDSQLAAILDCHQSTQLDAGPFANCQTYCLTLNNNRNDAAAHPISSVGSEMDSHHHHRQLQHSLHSLNENTTATLGNSSRCTRPMSCNLCACGEQNASGAHHHTSLGSHGICSHHHHHHYVRQFQWQPTHPPQQQYQHRISCAGPSAAPATTTRGVEPLVSATNQDYARVPPELASDLCSFNGGRNNMQQRGATGEFVVLGEKYAQATCRAGTNGPVGACSTQQMDGQPFPSVARLVSAYHAKEAHVRNEQQSGAEIMTNHHSERQKSKNNDIRGVIERNDDAPGAQEDSSDTNCAGTLPHSDSRFPEDQMVVVSKSTLSDLSDQIAFSIHKIRDLEEQVRIIPDLQRRLDIVIAHSNSNASSSNASNSRRCSEDLSSSLNRSSSININPFKRNSASFTCNNHMSRRTPDFFDLYEASPVTSTPNHSKCNKILNFTPSIQRHYNSFRRDHWATGDAVNDVAPRSRTHSLSNRTKENVKSSYMDHRQKQLFANAHTCERSNASIDRQNHTRQSNLTYPTAASSPSRHRAEYDDLINDLISLSCSVNHLSSSSNQLSSSQVKAPANCHNVESNPIIAKTDMLASMPNSNDEGLRKLDDSMDDQEDDQLCDYASTMSPSTITSHNVEFQDHSDFEEYCANEESLDTKTKDTTSPETDTPNDLKFALIRLNDFLNRKCSLEEIESSSSCLDIVRKEWFEAAAKEDSLAIRTKLHVDYFESFTKQLLNTIINLCDSAGNTAIHYAASYCKMDVVKVILDSKVCDVNYRNKAGYTPIMLLSLADIVDPQEQEVAKELFSIGNVNLKDPSRGQTALMLAATHKRLATCKLLLECGADPSLKDHDGSTALMCGSETGDEEVVKCLLSHRLTDPATTDNDGLDALTIAMNNGHKNIVLILYSALNVSRMVRSPNGEDKNQKSPYRTCIGASLRRSRGYATYSIKRNNSLLTPRRTNTSTQSSQPAKLK